MTRHIVRAPGLHRLDAEQHWWCTSDGLPVEDAATLERLRALAVPPSWTNVWAAADPEAPVQATGVDRDGRTQYRYSAAARRDAGAHKFAAMLAFAEVLPALRRTVHLHLTQADSDAETPVHRFAAAAVRLLDRGLFRVGNARYERRNHTYGLTTLVRSQVRVEGDRMVFDFVGKEHVAHHVVVEDHDAARALRSLLEQGTGPDERVFALADPPGWRHIDSATVNSYLHAFGGRSATAKVFRTWGATVAAVAVVAGAPVPPGVRRHRDVVLDAVEAAATLLGNTPAVARSSYVHPDAALVGRDGTVRAALQDALDRSRDGTYRAVIADPDFHAVVLDALRRGSPVEVRRA